MGNAVLTVGRSRHCDVILKEADISTVHCQLYTIQVDLYKEKRKLINIVDKSRNGTFINGNRLIKRDYLLKNGDKIVFGKSTSFLFKYIDTSEEIEGGIKSSTNDGVFKKPQMAASGSQTSMRKKLKQRPTSVFDKYLLERELGSGHYATVKEGINKQTGEVVAVKIFHPQQNDDQKKSNQFKEETDILMRVHHPNIVKMLDSFVEPVSKSQIQKYLVLEKMNDGELFDRIVKKVCLRQDETQALFKQILEGIKHLHSQNIIHRDIKPENILLNITKRQSPDERQLGPWDQDEIDVQVKIADFGLAKFTGEIQFTNTLCGTPSYVAPEVLLKSDYSSKVDIWSAGVLLYVCLCGFPPFSDSLGPPSMREQILQGKFAFYSPYWDEIDDSVLHLISNLLVVNASQRFNVIETMNHPWFIKSDYDRIPMETERLQISQEKIPKTYSELSKV
ncbi:hypothetical protein ZYGR_0AF02330 [Zygosaccharomyces rouxii]|uniref:DNA damage response protein kinase DUN1 n=1 Tax=Zygosaccharomyces rouxii TaxID=4956 RepID=A0A1Q3A7S6_ZYGRO|nr:hypothetical protein ZYGR_0AF02330 [Zygosaccharomyces rouxii]